MGGILCHFCRSLFSSIPVVSTLSSRYVRAPPTYRMVNAGSCDYKKKKKKKRNKDICNEGPIKV